MYLPLVKKSEFTISVVPGGNSERVQETHTSKVHQRDYETGTSEDHQRIVLDDTSEEQRILAADTSEDQHMHEAHTLELLQKLGYANSIFLSGM